MSRFIRVILKIMPLPIGGIRTAALHYSEAVAAASYVQWLSSNVKADSFLKEERERILAERSRINGPIDLPPSAAASLPVRIRQIMKRLFCSAQ